MDSSTVREAASRGEDRHSNNLQQQQHLSHSTVRVASGENNQVVETAVYGKRWVILALYMGIMFFNQVQYTTFSTIISETKEYYSASSLQVNMLAALYSVVYVVLVFPVIIFYEQAGFKWGMILAALFNAICGCLKVITLSSGQYQFLVIAQVFGGLSQVLMLALPPMLASLWFPVSERTVATAGGTLSGFMGISIAFFYSPLMLDEEATYPAFLKLWLSQAIPSVALFVATVLFVADHPPLPPSVTAKTANNAVKFTFGMLGTYLKKQLTDLSFIRLITGFGLSNGALAALASVLTQVMMPFGISEQETGAISSVGIFLASLNCIAVALIVDKKRVYKYPLIGMFATTLTGLSFIILVFYVVPVSNHTGMLASAYVLFIIAMAATLPGIPITLEFAVEKTYPDPEMIASSLTMLMWSVFSVIGSLVYSAVLTDTPTMVESRSAIFITIGVLEVAIGLIFTVDQKHHRHEHEKALAMEKAKNAVIF